MTDMPNTICAYIHAVFLLFKNKIYIYVHFFRCESNFFFLFFFFIGPQTFSLYLPIIRSQSLFKGVSGYNDLKDRL